MSKEKLDFSTGNVVKWGGSYWIVANYEWGLSSMSDYCDLISIDSPNCLARPSEKWPSEEDGIEAVVFVADSVASYIKKSMLANFPHCN